MKKLQIKRHESYKKDTEKKAIKRGVNYCMIGVLKKYQTKDLKGRLKSKSYRSWRKGCRFDKFIAWQTIKRFYTEYGKEEVRSAYEWLG